MTKPRRAHLVRRLLLGLLLFAGIVALALITTPWWWPHTARSLLARQGVTFERFDTLGYSRFVLHDVRFQNPVVTASVKRLEADTPIVWFAHGLFSRPGSLQLKTWQAEFKNTATSSDPATSLDGWPALQAQLSETLATLQKWLPEARATDGSFLHQKQKLTVASLNWLARDGLLTADGLTFRDQTGRASLRWHGADRRLTLSATTTDEQWSATLETRDNLLTGQLHLWKQPLDLRATFPARGWIPDDAELTAAPLAIPGRALKIGAYYPTLASEGRLTWKNARLILALSATGQPAENQSAPPLRLEIAGQGDTQSFRIERFDITFPGTTARLLAPIVIDRDAQIRSGASQFSLDSDLSKIPGITDLRGKITGRVRVEPGANDTPRLTAQLEASDLHAPELDIKSAVFDAEQLDATLTIKNARLAFTDGSTAEAEGTWNWRERSLAAGKLEGDIKPVAFARWLPASLTFARLTVSAEAAGRWPQIKHSGKFALADLAAGTPKPLTAAGTWEGTGPAADKLLLDLKTGNSAASLQARVSPTEAVVDSLDLTLPDAPPLRLAQPALFRWQPSLSIGKLDLSGGDTRLSLAWSDPQTGTADIALTNLESVWLRDFIPARWPHSRIDSARVEGRWPDGVFLGTAQLQGHTRIGPDKIARLELNATARAGTLHIEQLLVRDDAGPIVEARGDAPLVFTPVTAPFWKIDPAGNWSLTATTTPDSPFWIAQAEASGAKLRAPKLFARIEGSVQKPDARIELQAAEIAFANTRLPPLSSLDARLILDDGHVTLERLSLLVAGQPITASGRTSIQAQQWSGLLQNPRQLWTGDAEARLEIPSIQIASIAPFLPDVVAPTGTFTGALTVRADGQIDGSLHLDDASTHPISPFGSFSRISGEIVFSGREATLKSLNALASGQAMNASGSVEFPAGAPLKLDVALSGKNLPLARQTGLLIRGDLDLHVKTAGDGRTTLGGEVNLHDSLFLRDVRSLIPSRGGSPSSRPPYFSVTKAPFRDWQLALKVGGNRFITLRTPLFSGVVSGQFNLTGTLYEPIAIGQVTFNEGTILLPFAALRLTSGSVRLTQADPYSPQLSINASARTLGYDVRMELSGPASEPSLTFSSSPPLTSEQVLLMVMAGETPRSDFSYSNTQRATSIGMYLGKSLLSDFFGDPASAEKFTYSTGENVTETGKETASIEYKLNDRWSLVGERDEFDDYNAGVKLRIFTAQKKPAADAPKP